MSRISDRSADLFDERRVLGFRQLALDDPLEQQLRGSSDPIVRAVGRERSRWRIRGRRPNELGCDADLTGESLDAADRHRAARGCDARLKLRRALHDFLHFAPVVATPDTGLTTCKLRD